MTLLMKRIGNIILLCGLIYSLPDKNVNGNLVDINLVLYLFFYLIFICFLVASAYYLIRTERYSEVETPFVEDYDEQMCQTAAYNGDMRVDANAGADIHLPNNGGIDFGKIMWGVGCVALDVISPNLRNTISGLIKKYSSDDQAQASENIQAIRNMISPTAPPSSDSPDAVNADYQGGAVEHISNEQLQNLLNREFTRYEEERRDITALLNSNAVPDQQEIFESYIFQMWELEPEVHRLAQIFYSSQSDYDRRNLLRYIKLVLRRLHGFHMELRIIFGQKN
jgi:hypothetical protein